MENTENTTTTLKFRTVVDRPEARDTAGIVVPPEIVEALGKGKRPPVRVTINGYTYRSTIAVMGGRYLLPLSMENRKPAGVSAGDEVEIHLALDTEVRTVEVPDDLAAALDAAGKRDAFDTLAFTYRKEHVRSVTEAKAAETRARRIAKVLTTLN
ncbi:YdeI/OmpD-associated family protein [Asticcacaulis taihuensis]|uniref:Bacteriocin-protection, YdeI or OmpD-Associated n=1 Tax=Asticcacaulis taihuensis TaxID=260084 RepID=A0A1G4RZN6_9CAUL|nr:YdeI/OmpD-associated family protein [Asticcacaulis taihuensis]SCW62320.1 Bacteriocin-protection, YdeI or OmpD-Associated [Asticcacaulis taihuensis]